MSSGEVTDLGGILCRLILRFFFSALPFLVSLIVELVNIKMNNWRMIILPPTTESHSEFFISYEQFSRARFPFPDSFCSKNEPSLLWHLRKPPIPWISCLNTFFYDMRAAAGLAIRNRM